MQKLVVGDCPSLGLSGGTLVDSHVAKARLAEERRKEEERLAEERRQEEERLEEERRKEEQRLEEERRREEQRIRQEEETLSLEPCCVQL